MAYTYSFFDNQTVGAEDLNKWVSLFVSPGVADDFENGIPYSVSMLNNAVYNNCSAGVVPADKQVLQVTVSGNTAYIAPGIAFFEDGTVLEITATETVQLPTGDVRYVYLKSSVEENRAYPAASAEMPSGNVVLLAQIAANGTVTDLRRYAKGKVPSFYASDAGLPGKKRITLTDTGTVELYCGNNDYTTMLLVGKRHNAQSRLQAVFYCEVDLVTGKTESMYVYIYPRIYGGNFSERHAEFYFGENFEIVPIDHDFTEGYVKVEGRIEKTEDKINLVTVKAGSAEDRYYTKNAFPVEMDVYLV